MILALGAVRVILQSPNHLHHMPLIKQKLQHTCSIAGRAETCMGSGWSEHCKILWPKPLPATAGLMGSPGTEVGEQLEASMPTQGKLAAKGCSQPEGDAHCCTCLAPAGCCQVQQAAKKRL